VKVRVVSDGKGDVSVICAYGEGVAVTSDALPKAWTSARK